MKSEPGIPQTRQRDPAHYYEEGNVIFLCGKSLFRLHRSRLARKSEYFKDMFNVGSDVRILDGYDDEHPLNLNKSGISEEDFRNFCTFLYDSDELPKDTPLKFFESVLVLSDMWMVDSGKRFVLTHLPKHPEFTQAMKIRLSRQFNIHEWLEPAFRALVACSTGDISPVDADNMGAVTLYSVIKTKTEVFDHLRYLAYWPPPVRHGWSCLDEVECSKWWDGFWWNVFARQLLHPNNTKTAKEILEKADWNVGFLSQMGNECLRRTFDDIWDENPFEIDGQLVDVAFNDFKKWVEGLGI
ncbi:Atp-dependent helicase nam7 [Mycena indigotica]|uniref:Atp-dependent helicase nam7 n=1 Tax=Mycena indigotica TaxID=2126181 RepID=A0A8H6SWS0_9AGAR|nr:Atp-dependent helicase nam7 [Mycena indigotica]KAF7306247.1 Atp-dependent helicase nam7 [Mycena indigotica]